MENASRQAASRSTCFTIVATVVATVPNPYTRPMAKKEQSGPVHLEPPNLGSPRDINAILRDLRSGLRYREVGERHNLGPRQVAWIARRHGLLTRQPMSHANDPLILDDLRAGMSYREAGAKHGRSKSAIQDLAMRNGMRRTRGGGRRRSVPKSPPIEDQAKPRDAEIADR
jgi:hypothetical protein